MKLVTYSEPGKQTKTRPGLLWGNWILDLQDIPSLSSRLEVKISKRITKLSDLSSTLDLVESGTKAMEDLQKLSWRIFNRLGPDKMPRTVKNLTEVSIRPPIPRPPVLRDFYSFEDHVKAARARRGLQIPSERYDLSMKARVNGKELSNGNMKSIHWTFPQMIARASQSVEVHPGEVFGSGTVGTGSILELGTEVHRWLRPDDEVELEIERLGVLRNRIIQSTKS